MTKAKKPLPEVELVNLAGPTSVHITATVNDAGNLVLSGQDIGEAASAMFGDSDYEYWLTIKAEHKDAALLALLRSHYTNDARVVGRLMDLFTKYEVPFEKHSF